MLPSEKERTLSIKIDLETERESCSKTVLSVLDTVSEPTDLDKVIEEDPTAPYVVFLGVSSVVVPTLVVSLCGV